MRHAPSRAPGWLIVNYANGARWSSSPLSNLTRKALIHTVGVLGAGKAALHFTLGSCFRHNLGDPEARAVTHSISTMPGVVSDNLPAALLVGAPGSGKHALIQALAGPSEKHHRLPYALCLDNKYYMAAVALHAGSARQTNDLADYEGVVLVFDASDEASFRAVAAWHGLHAEASADAGVRLVVATKADMLKPGGAREPWLAAAQDWCNEQMYEYVETAAAVPQVDQHLEADGEAQGVSRVRAALEVSAHGALHGHRCAGPGSATPVKRACGVLACPVCGCAV